MASLLKQTAKPIQEGLKALQQVTKPVHQHTKPLLPPCMHSQKVGVVVSAGKMKGVVKVRVAEQVWNKQFRKHFPAPKNYLVRDQNESLVSGDVVRITSGFRTSKLISHAVTAIIAPFGDPVEQRPPVLTTEQLEKQKVQEKLLKDVRASQRGRQASIHRIQEAKKQGLRIPTMEEAMAGLKAYEADLEERGVGAGKNQKHKGQAGQQTTAKQRRIEAGRKLKEEVKAAKKAKLAKEQATS
jgi:small subunit ribosomal protein S17